jgi:hypothetical protein
MTVDVGFRLLRRPNEPHRCQLPRPRARARQAGSLLSSQCRPYLRPSRIFTLRKLAKQAEFFLRLYCARLVEARILRCPQRIKKILHKAA